jgi:hypothetical protein
LRRQRWNRREVSLSSLDGERSTAPQSQVTHPAVREQGSTDEGFQHGDRNDADLRRIAPSVCRSMRLRGAIANRFNAAGAGD